MKYKGSVFGSDAELSIEREGIRLGKRFLDYSEVKYLRPINHRIIIETLSGESLEISMLGFSFDGFWEELIDCFGKRSLESLFVDEESIMICEGEYIVPVESPEERKISLESGRAKIALFPDSVCILPQTVHAVRIPLSFTERIWLDGYQIHLILDSGTEYIVGKMGYDTKPFAERAENAAKSVKQKRSAVLSGHPVSEHFSEKGLFRTKDSEFFWNAAFGTGKCAVELFTGEDSATYLYQYSEPRDAFDAELQKAMEAVGTHREMIYMTDEQLADKPLYQMSIQRTPAVRYLRKRSAGRLIHNANHSQKLREFLS